MRNGCLFISDVHLGLENTENEIKKENSLIKLIELHKNQIGYLFIVGDLFDYWFEYKYVYQKGYNEILSVFKKLVSEGIEIHYLIGNHDFMHKDFFEKQIGVKLHRNNFNFEIETHKFFIAHGDDFVYNDYGYKILKKILRNRFTQCLYSIIHPDFGIWLASSISKKSRNYTDKKEYGKIDGLLETAKSKIDFGIDYVIMGHTHIKKIVDYKSGIYVNLGSWLNKPYYAIYKNNKLEILEWEID